jgi:hypothetical protein
MSDMFCGSCMYTPYWGHVVCGGLNSRKGWGGGGGDICIYECGNVLLKCHMFWYVWHLSAIHKVYILTFGCW